MSVQVRSRRESAAFLSTYVGAQGELLVDTTNNRVQVHDGVTPGGWPAAKLSEVVATTRTTVSDTNYAVTVKDRNLAITSLTASRTVTLPAALLYPTGTQLVVFDESGSCSATRTIAIARAGTDTINGASSAVIGSAYGYLALESNGASRWTIVDQSVGSAAAPLNNTTAAADPTSAADSSQGYAPGSLWLRPTTGRLFFCRDASVAAAVWLLLDNADFFGYVANNWYLPWIDAPAVVGTASPANIVRLIPIDIKQRVTLSALDVRITTGTSGGNVQAAVYGSNPTTLRPTGTPLVTTASMSTTTAAFVSSAVSIQLDPGLYWLATMVDNATTAFYCKATTDLQISKLCGSAAESSMAGNLGITGLSAAASAFSTWPDLTSATITELLTAVVPIVRYKIGSVP